MNKKRLLIVLFGILALSVLYAVWQTPRQERVAAPAHSVTAGRKAQKEGNQKNTPDTMAGEELRVRLELLQREEKGASRPRRDLFAPLYTIKPQVPKPVSPPPPTVAAPPPPPVAAPRPPAPPPPVQFSFLGFLQKEVENTVFLSAKDEVFIVKKGDSFGRDRQFSVAELTAERLVIRQKDRQQPIIISLSEPGMAVPSGAAPPGTSRSFRSPPPPPRAQNATPDEEPAEEVPPVENGDSESAPAAEPPPETGILQPVPRSNFNNLFSDDGNRKSNPDRSAMNGTSMPPEEVPR